MGLRNDLIEARKLIDTPEKLAVVGSVRDAMRLATNGDHARDIAAFHAYMDQPGDDRFVIERGHSYVKVQFASFLDRFDRAINATPVDFTGLDAALDELRKPVDEVRE